MLGMHRTEDIVLSSVKRKKILTTWDVQTEESEQSAVPLAILVRNLKVNIAHLGMFS